MSGREAMERLREGVRRVMASGWVFDEASDGWEEDDMHRFATEVAEEVGRHLTAEVDRALRRVYSIPRPPEGKARERIAEIVGEPQHGRGEWVKGDPRTCTTCLKRADRIIALLTPHDSAVPPLASGQTPVTREPERTGRAGGPEYALLRRLFDMLLVPRTTAMYDRAAEVVRQWMKDYGVSEASSPEWDEAVAIVQRAHANGHVEAYELRGPKGFWSASGDTEGSEPSVREADSERLDWLEATGGEPGRMERGGWFIQTGAPIEDWPEGETLREAIDNARLASTPTRDVDTEADDGE